MVLADQLGTPFGEPFALGSNRLFGAHDHAKLRLGPLPATLANLAFMANWPLRLGMGQGRSIHIVRVMGLSRHWENMDMILRKHRKTETRRVKGFMNECLLSVLAQNESCRIPGVPECLCNKSFGLPSEPSA